MKVTNNLYIHKTIFFIILKKKKQLLNTKHLGGDKRQIYSFGLFK